MTDRLLDDPPPRAPKDGPADDGKTYPPRYMRRCVRFLDADHGGPGFCGRTPTRHGPQGPACRDHAPTQPRPNPEQTLDGLRKAAGENAPPPPPPQSASRVHDDRAVASGKRRSTPNAYREARSRLAEKA